MLDRLKVDIVGRGRYDNGPGWEELSRVDLKEWDATEAIRTKEHPISGELTNQRWRIFRHNETNFRVSGPVDFGPRTVEFSGPRILGNSNGKLLRTQEDLDLMAKRAGDLLREVSPDATFKVARVATVELAWHFFADPCEWVPFYSALKFPRIESVPTSWREEFETSDYCIHGATAAKLRHRPCSVAYSPTSVTWTGDKLRIRLYDKVAAMGLSGCLAPVMRLELKFEDRLAVGLIDTEGRFSFPRIYERYRNFSGYFRAFECDRSHNGSPIDFLLYQYIQGRIPAHEFQAFLAAQSRATVDRYMARLRSITSVWTLEPGIIARLPVDGPPEAPDVVSPPRKGVAP